VEKKLEDRRGTGAAASLIALCAVQSVPLLLVTVNSDLTVCIHMYQSRYICVNGVSGVDKWIKLFLLRPGQATEVSRRMRLPVFPDNRHINLLTLNVNYSGRTAPLTSKVAFYISIQQI